MFTENLTRPCATRGFLQRSVRYVLVRSCMAQPDKTYLQRFQREVNIWRLVWEADKGKYILPFYGTVTDDGP